LRPAIDDRRRRCPAAPPEAIFLRDRRDPQHGRIWSADRRAGSSSNDGRRRLARRISGGLTYVSTWRRTDVIAGGRWSLSKPTVIGLNTYNRHHRRRRRRRRPLVTYISLSPQPEISRHTERECLRVIHHRSIFSNKHAGTALRVTIIFRSFIYLLKTQHI